MALTLRRFLGLPSVRVVVVLQDDAWISTPIMGLNSELEFCFKICGMLFADFVVFGTLTATR
jgi:hypothetical protein